MAERLNELNYGDFISHEQIASIIEEDYPSNKYSTTIAKTKKILLKKYNKTIENILTHNPYNQDQPIRTIDSESCGKIYGSDIACPTYITMDIGLQIQMILYSNH